MGAVKIKGRGLLATVAMAVALAGGAQVALIGLPGDEAHAQRQRAQQPQEVKRNYSADYSAPAQAAQTAIDANDFVTAKTQLDLAETKVTTPDDKLSFGQLTFNLGNKSDDLALKTKGVQAMIDSGQLAPADVGRFQYYLGSFHYEADSYPAAQAAFERAIALGYKDSNIEGIYAESFFQQEKFAEGLAVLKTAIDGRRAANAEVPENWYKRGTSVAFNANLSAETMNWVIMLVEAAPSKDNWRSALTIARETLGYGSQENIDVMRLMRRTDSLVSERDYGEYAENADPRRLPGEVLAVLEDGVAKGVVKTSDVFFAEQLSLARGRVAADRAELSSLERSAQSSANGVSALATGDALLGYGEAARAQAMYELALQKGGIDADRANTRLGIALSDQGKYAEAQAAFDKVTGARGPLIKLWKIYTAAKQAPAAPAAPAPAAG